MPTVKNTTRKPISVPLPGGKTLRLGPLKSGEIRAGAVDHAPLQRMVSAGTIEVAGGVGGSSRGRSGVGESTGSPLPQGGHSGGGGAIRKSGDR